MHIDCRIQSFNNQPQQQFLKKITSFLTKILNYKISSLPHSIGSTCKLQILGRARFTISLNYVIFCGLRSYYYVVTKKKKRKYPSAPAAELIIIRSEKNVIIVNRSLTLVRKYCPVEDEFTADLHGPRVLDTICNTGGVLVQRNI